MTLSQLELRNEVSVAVKKNIINNTFCCRLFGWFLFLFFVFWWVVMVGQALLLSKEVLNFAFGDEIPKCNG